MKTFGIHIISIIGMVLTYFMGSLILYWFTSFFVILTSGRGKGSDPLGLVDSGQGDLLVLNVFNYGLVPALAIGFSILVGSSVLNNGKSKTPIVVGILIILYAYLFNFMNNYELGYFWNIISYLSPLVGAGYVVIKLRVNEMELISSISLEKEPENY